MKKRALPKRKTPLRVGNAEQDVRRGQNVMSSAKLRQGSGPGPTQVRLQRRHKTVAEQAPVAEELQGQPENGNTQVKNSQALSDQ